MACRCIYGMNGTLNLDDLAAKAAGEPSLGVILGLVFIVVAIAFKFGAVPFHMWVPDVYTAHPPRVTLFLSTVPKIASFALAFRLLAHGMGSVGSAWQDMLAPLAVLSLIFGNVIAIAQTESQAHAGVFGHRQRGLHPARLRRRHRRRLRSGAVLHGRVRAHDAGLFRRAGARQPRGLRGRQTSTTTRDCTSAIRCWRCP